MVVNISTMLCSLATVWDRIIIHPRPAVDIYIVWISTEGKYLSGKVWISTRYRYL